MLSFSTSWSTRAVASSPSGQRSNTAATGSLITGSRCGRRGQVPAGRGPAALRGQGGRAGFDRVRAGQLVEPPRVGVIASAPDRVRLRRSTCAQARTGRLGLLLRTSDWQGRALD